MKQNKNLIAGTLIICLTIIQAISGISGIKATEPTGETTYVTTEKLFFGLVDIIGATKTLDFSITNTGDEVLVITGINVPFTYTANLSSAEVQPGETLTFQITFNPPHTKAFSGEVVIQSNGTLEGITPTVVGKGIIIYR